MCALEKEEEDDDVDKNFNASRRCASRNEISFCTKEQTANDDKEIAPLAGWKFEKIAQVETE